MTSDELILGKTYRFSGKKPVLDHFYSKCCFALEALLSLSNAITNVYSLITMSDYLYIPSFICSVNIYWALIIY